MCVNCDRYAVTSKMRMVLGKGGIKLKIMSKIKVNTARS